MNAGTRRRASPNARDRLVEPVVGLQRQAEVVPRDRVVGLQIERAPVRGDRVVDAVRRGEPQSEIVLELGLSRHRRRGALEQRQRGVEAPVLIFDDAEVVHGERLVGRGGQRGAVAALGGREVAAAMRIEAGAGERIGGRRCRGRGRHFRWG